jgi:hypothetical protein
LDTKKKKKKKMTVNTMRRFFFTFGWCQCDTRKIGVYAA